MSFNPDFETIGNAFVQHYYSKFDVPDPAARPIGLSDLYDPHNSYMTFEGVQVKGRDQILLKFSGLTFKSIQRAITKTDAQPLPDGSILVTVFGQLKTDEDPIQSYNQMLKGKGKQGTKGQKQIYDENWQTVLNYGIASVASLVLYASLAVFLWKLSGWEWFGLVMTAFVLGGAMLLLKLMASAKFNEKGQVVDAGLDLNDPDAFGEYCKDSVILSVLALLLAIYSSYSFLLLLLIPGFAIYKVMRSIILPWIFAPAPEDDVDPDEKRKKKDRRIVLKARR